VVLGVKLFSFAQVEQFLEVLLISPPFEILDVPGPVSVFLVSAHTLRSAISFLCAVPLDQGMEIQSLEHDFFVI
jgi:hypothetical protein